MADELKASKTGSANNNSMTSFSMLALFGGVEHEAANAMSDLIRAKLGDEGLAAGREALQEWMARADGLRERVSQRLDTLRARHAELEPKNTANEPEGDFQTPAATAREVEASSVDENEQPERIRKPRAKKFKIFGQTTEQGKIGAEIEILKDAVSVDENGESVATGLAFAQLSAEKRLAAARVLRAAQEAAAAPATVSAYTRALFMPLSPTMAALPVQGLAAVAEPVQDGGLVALRVGRALGVIKSDTPKEKAAREESARWGFALGAQSESGSFDSQLRGFLRTERTPQSHTEIAVLKRLVRASVAQACGLDPSQAIHALEALGNFAPAPAGWKPKTQAPSADATEGVVSWRHGLKKALGKREERAPTPKTEDTPQTASEGVIGEGTDIGAALSASMDKGFSQARVSVVKNSEEEKSTQKLWGEEQSDRDAIELARPANSDSLSPAEAFEAWSGRVARGMKERYQSLWKKEAEQSPFALLDLESLGLGFGRSEKPQLSPEELGEFSAERSKRAEEAALARRAARFVSLDRWASAAADWAQAERGQALGSLAMAAERDELPKDAAQAILGSAPPLDQYARIATMMARTMRMAQNHPEAEATPKAPDGPDLKALAEWFSPRRESLDAAGDALATLREASISTDRFWREKMEDIAIAAHQAIPQEQERWARENGLGKTQDAVKAVFGDQEPTPKQLAFVARNPAVVKMALEECGAHGRVAARLGLWLGLDPLAAANGNQLCAMAREAWLRGGSSVASWKSLGQMPDEILAFFEKKAISLEISPQGEKRTAAERSLAGFVDWLNMGTALNMPRDAVASLICLMETNTANDGYLGEEALAGADAAHFGALNAWAPDSATRSKEGSDVWFYDALLRQKISLWPATAEKPWTRESSRAGRALANALTVAKTEDEENDNLTPQERQALADDHKKMIQRRPYVIKAFFDRSEKLGLHLIDSEKDRQSSTGAFGLRLPLSLTIAGDPSIQPETEAAKRTREKAERLDRERNAFHTQVNEVTDWLSRAEVGVWDTLPAQPQWPVLARRAREWHEMVEAEQNAEHDAKQWNALLGEQADGEFTAMELTTGRELREEGSAMHHCVSTYAGDCRSGKARIFSIKKNGERHSTLELNFDKKTGRWSAGQNLGVCNTHEIDQRAFALGEKLAAKATQLQLRPSRPENAAGAENDEDQEREDFGDAQAENPEGAVAIDLETNGLGGDGFAGAPVAFAADDALTPEQERAAEAVQLMAQRLQAQRGARGDNEDVKPENGAPAAGMGGL